MSNSTTNYNNEDLITESWEILGGPGISVENVDGSYTISSDSSGVLTDGIDGLDDATTIQDALTVLAERVATADGIRSGAVIKASGMLLIKE